MALSPPPVSQRPGRLGAAQPLNRPPSSGVQRQGSTYANPVDRRYLAHYMDWQEWARRFAHTMGIVRFAGSLKSDTCARCELVIEERDPSTDEWEPTDEARLTNVFDLYRNPLEEPPELIRCHAWHYSISGEMAQVYNDGPNGVDWGIYSLSAIERNRPNKGLTRVKLTPNGHERDGSAFVVPSDQVIRFWIPDEEWKGLATSPMAAAAEPLRRYHSLVRGVKRIADSRLLQNGLLWTPAEAHEGDNEEMVGGSSPGAQQRRSKLNREYYEIAKRVFQDDDDIMAVAPYMVWWGSSGAEPKHIKIGQELDEQGIAHRKEALEDFARGIDLPSSLVVGGGPGDANHWTEWLVDRKYFSQAIAPTMNRITHQDLTATFLRPALRFYRLPEDRFRVGYDPNPVIVPDDQSDTALKLHMAGLLGDEATLEAANFDLGQAMKPEELMRLLMVLGKTQAGMAPAQPPGSTITVNTGRPIDQRAEPPELAAGSGPPVAVDQGAARTSAAQPGVGDANALIARLVQLRRDLGRDLLASAETAFAAAMRQAGVRLVNRGRTAAVKRQLRDVMGEDGPLVGARARLADAGPVESIAAHMAAVGLTEAELLDDQFAAYERRARSKISQSVRRQRAVIRDAGLEPDVVLADDRDRQEAAAAFLAAALLATARTRLTEGPGRPEVGEVSGDVPGSIVAGALDIAAGFAHAEHAATHDERPTLVADGGSIEEVVGVELIGPDARIEYQWEWGFYGDPVQPFEPHEDLGVSGFTTTDREGDPALTSSEDWIDGDVYAPQDHDGCTCTWIPVIGVESGPGERPVNFPVAGTQAREVAGVGAG